LISTRVKTFPTSNSLNYTQPRIDSYNGTLPGIPYPDGQQPCVGGANLLLTGEHFGYADFSTSRLVDGVAVPWGGRAVTVGIGDYPCKTTLYISDTMVSCIQVPIGAGTGNDVWMTAEEIRSIPNALYDYDPPYILSIFPSSAINTRGGDIISIRGINFGPYDLTTRGRHEPLRNISVSRQWCNAVYKTTDATILCSVPEFVGKRLDIKVIVEDQNSADSGAGLMTYKPPEVSTVTPSVNAEQAGGSQVIIFGDYLGPLRYVPEIFIGPKGATFEDAEYSGACTAVEMRIAHVMLQCIYPAGRGFELDVIATVGNQSSAPNEEAKLSYVDLSGARTVNATMEIVVNRTAGFCQLERETLYVGKRKDTALDIPANLNVDGLPKCGLYNKAIYHDIEVGLSDWLSAITVAISMAPGDVFILEQSIVICDAAEREFYGTKLVNRKGKATDLGKEYLKVLAPQTMFQQCEYFTDENGDGESEDLEADAYQQFTITALATGTYEASKIKSFWTNISLYESAMDYVNRYLCGCYVDGVNTVWDDDWQKTCDHCAVTQLYGIRVTERPEIYCPGGQELLAGVGGIYSCGVCPQGDKSDGCNNMHRTMLIVCCVCATCVCLIAFLTTFLLDDLNFLLRPT
jgi:hypothetical protein